MREETSLDVELVELLGVYSDPARDPRGHTIPAVYVGRARGTPRADDDAAEVRVFVESALPAPMALLLSLSPLGDTPPANMTHQRRPRV